MRMRISELKMALISVEDQLELLPLENSTSLVWKFFGFPSHDGKMIERDKKKRKRVFVNYVNAIIRMWEIQLIYGNI